MPVNKNIAIAIVSFIICCIAASLIAVVMDMPRIVSILTGLIAIVAVAVMGMAFVGVLTSVESMNDTLNSDRPAKVIVRKSSLIKPLEIAFNSFIGQYNDKIEGLDDHDSEMSLQYQLLRRQKHNIEAILHSIRDTVIVTDAFDRLVLANAAAEKLFGFKLQKDAMPAVDEIIGDQEFVRLVVKSRRSKTPHVRHEVTFEKDSQARIFDCIISCVKDEEGVVSGVIAVLHDVTREKEISQMKNDFVSHVSHELKTPLASINAYAEMLVDGEAGDQETVTEFCTIIQNQAQRLNRLIEDILNISRIESGLTKVEKHPLSLAILTADAVKMIESYAQEKSITVNTQAPIIYDQALADKDMITQVIINLLSNAVKYTPAGGKVDINVEVDQAQDVVRVTVADTGVGIPPEDVEHVFDKFFRVEANKKQAKGTGLGLNLVKQIVEKVHDGTVFVSSIQGQGSAFGFTLPLAAQRVTQTA